MRMTAALSGHLDGDLAAESACRVCAEALGDSRPTLVTLFLSSHHVESAKRIGEIVRNLLGPECLIGVSAETVAGGEVEMEGVPAISIMAASLPGVTPHPFSVESLPSVTGPGRNDHEALARAAGLAGDHRATILLCDPFSVAVNQLLPALSSARRFFTTPRNPDERPSPIIGGMASAANKAGGNALILNDRVVRAGGVGVSLVGTGSGGVQVDALVSQGCKPIGQPLVITGGKGQMITQLAGRSAVAVLTETLDALDEANRQKLRGGLFIGRAINEYKSRFGRSDFLMRNVVGVDRGNEAIAVADIIRIGQTIQFHIRDAQTAIEDLELLLDAQRLYETPAGVLLFTCNGRGTRLFDHPHHDAGAISRNFREPLGGELVAKGGKPMPPIPSRSPLPLAGFFCAGEIGPIHDQVFLHGQTACAAIFRALP